MKEQYIEVMEAQSQGSLTEADVERLRTQCLLDELVGIRNEVEERLFRLDFDFKDAEPTREDLAEIHTRLRELIIKFA